MRPTKRQIAEEVAARHGLTLADLRSGSRKYPIVRARHEASALCYACRGDERDDPYSLLAIGRYFGAVGHSATHYGIRAHKARQARAVH